MSLVHSPSAHPQPDSAKTVADLEATLQRLSDAAEVFAFLNARHPMYSRFNLAIIRLRDAVFDARDLLPPGDQ